MASNESPFTAPRPASLKNRRRIRWWLIISIFAVPFLLISSAVAVVRVGYTIREHQGQKQMMAEMDKLASEGWPVDNEGIDALYVSRTSPDNVEQWLGLLAHFTAPETKRLNAGVPLLDPTIDDEFAFETVRDPDWKYAEVCQRHVDQQAELIAEAARLAAEPTPVQFPIFFDSMETLLPEVQSLRDLGRLVTIDAHVAIHAGDGTRAARDFELLYNLGDQADAVPGAIPRLVGIALRQLGLEVLQRLVTHDLLSDEQLHEIDRRLQSHCQIGTRWRDILSEERGLYLPAFLNPAMAMPSKKRLPARGHDAVYFIEIIRQGMAIDADKWPEFYEEVKRLEESLRPDKGFSLRNLDRLLTHVVSPAYIAIANALIRSVQANRLARMAIAVRLYQRRHQNWPASLQELGAEASSQLHPFGPKPFGYKLTNDAAVLWGFNLTDEQMETPESPIEPDPNMPGSVYNARWIWQLQR